jgi:hypothetical protein
MDNSKTKRVCGVVLKVRVEDEGEGHTAHSMRSLVSGQRTKMVVGLDRQGDSEEPLTGLVWFVEVELSGV